jgi:hypothetical protein
MSEILVTVGVEGSTDIRAMSRKDQHQCQQTMQNKGEGRCEVEAQRLYLETTVCN